MVNGEEVRGRFSDWTADIRFDPEQLDKSSIRATVRLASVASGDQGRDGMLQGDDFFGAARPMARFTAERIRARGGNRYQADGALTLKGISQPLSLAFSLNIRGDRAQAQATTRFDRRDFGIGTGQFAGTDVIGGDVHIDLAFNARRIAENG
jgi:polyisoprenoid-binding protein YceI